ncbi:uncharacterized protein J8A68_002343 [[Candida] subhashii]|uniref:C2H2-type domain-containing protein n=1 Tax=[Candida] subhashii TaxID=561895 RepID=A0A8J5QM28_9ASCO|nr:uncharacterized protein J8A68_002343 [[Candida] subhashii]KAG7664089.1 hypothetical protein J8A68_002343 [[Candida] subhashii]
MMSSSNQYVQKDEDQLYDILNLSPPAIVVKPSSTSESWDTTNLINDTVGVNGGQGMNYQQQQQQMKEESNYNIQTKHDDVSSYLFNQQRMHSNESNNNDFEPPPAPVEELTNDPLPDLSNYGTAMYQNDDTASDISLNTSNMPRFSSTSTTNDYLSPTSLFAGHQFSGQTTPRQSSFSHQPSQLQGSNRLVIPRSPSTHSVYSETSTHPASPYLQPSGSSHNLEAQPPQTYNSALSDVGDQPQNMFLPDQQYLESVPVNNFIHSEIALGESISSTNLANLDSVDTTSWQPTMSQRQQHEEFQELSFKVQNQQRQYQFQQSQQQQQPQMQQHPVQQVPQPQIQPEDFFYTDKENMMGVDFDITVTPPPFLDSAFASSRFNQFETISNAATNNSNTIQQSNPLTENNLSNYTSQLQQDNTQGEESGIIISIHQAPEEFAAKTPSLFSNSSANSSLRGRNNNSSSNLIPNAQLIPSSPAGGGSNKSQDQSREKDLLDPTYQAVKRGRRKSHSQRSVSGSKSPRRRSSSRYTEDEDSQDEDESDSDDEGTGNKLAREKILELASPNQSSKRTQKHPSIYSCHLCDKRFTRPYNLKSHLRTHTDERPFICSTCGKAFARQHDRKRHEDLHSGEKKYQCRGYLKDGSQYGCGRRFARADALRRHFQTEAGKQCIRSLMEEEELEKMIRRGDGMEEDEENNNNSNDSSMMNIPSVDITPPL